MCGIAGVHDYRHARAVDPEVLARMLGVITHRGPDDEGVLVDGDVAVGNRRLAIIDLAGGHQPMTNEDGSVVLVFNGEIYNYRELAARLRALGHVLATDCDTEPIVHLYEEHGDALVHELRGMFAFAIWDRRRRRLLLARDRLGIKPLYYADVGGRLVFGSEIKAVLQHPDVPRRIDPEALGHFLALKYVPAPFTLFEGVRALPPGHRLVCDGLGVRTERYWDVSYARAAGGRRGGSRLDEREAAAQLRELLVDAVRSHLVSDVPFGAFLSGGVDSSTVVGVMSGMLDHPVRTFSVGYEGDAARYSELPYARLVARRYRTEHHELIMGPDDFVESFERVAWHLDEPIADEACIPSYLLSVLAAQHVKMVLTGEGGDELFAGYARYAGERLSPFTRHLPGPLRALALRGIDRLPGLRRPKIAWRALLEPDEARRFARWFPLFDDERRSSLLSSDLRASLDVAATAGLFRAHLADTDAREPLDRMLYVDTKLWLADDLLARGDKTSMAASLEARPPLLDHPLVEFAASLPPRMKLRGRTRKLLLREVAREWVPTPVLERTKQGFPTPVSMWFRGPARELLRDHLAPDVVRGRGLFDPGAVGRLLEEHEAGLADHGSLLFGLLGLELWQRAYLDERPAVLS